MENRKLNLIEAEKNFRYSLLNIFPADFVRAIPKTNRILGMAQFVLIFLLFFSCTSRPKEVTESITEIEQNLLQAELVTPSLQEELPPEAAVELPQIILPPEKEESLVYQPVLPDPPPFVFPVQEDPPFASEGDFSDITGIDGFPEDEFLTYPETTTDDFPDNVLFSEQLVSPEPTVRQALQAPPPAPPFLQLPEREIAAAVPEEEPETPFFNLPDPPVVHPNQEEEKIVFSRIIRALVGQMIEIPFRGTGWVYTGEIGSRRGLSYDSRRLDPEGQTFVFRAEIPETYILKFDKRDFIRDFSINDYVQVIVGESEESSAQIFGGPPVDRGRVTAEPRWPLTDGQAASTALPLDRQMLSSSAETTGDAIQNVSGTLLPQDNLFLPEDLPAEENPAFFDAEANIRQAKNDFDAGRLTQAFSALDQFRLNNADMNDEALWLYAQLLEANSPNRDIKLALDCYKKIISDFPGSYRIPEARQRIAYLERYFFNIR